MVTKRSSGALLDPKQTQVREYNGILYLEHDSHRVELLAPRRTLPLSSPDEWILLSSSRGEELGIIRRLSELDAKSRAAIRASLENTYRITTILRVLEVEREPLGGQITWRVVTQLSENDAEGSGAGHEITFRLAGAEDVQTARYPHIYFADVDGNRYEIPDCEAMDLASRRASERYF